MTAPLTLTELEAALAATWPAAAVERLGPVVLRTGAGGGKRVSAATLEGPFDADAIDQAISAMRARGQRPLFRIRPGEEALDAYLAEKGFRRVEPVRCFAGAIGAIARPPRPVTLFGVWPPLAIQRALWAEAGIGPERQAVMARAAEPKAAFIARIENRAAAVAFAASSGRVAMLHALYVLPAFRQKGVGKLVTSGAAHWAMTHGAQFLALLVTEENKNAQALYFALGMQDVLRQHYRESPE